ncbi:MAG: redoxin domain-containing protein [Bacteroidales bacterium]|nr:redoxin domain-containing protein [Bacteroidales bacterium]
MKRLFTLILIAFFTITLSAQTPLDTAKNFTVKDLEGNIHELFEILDEGNMVLINFYTTTCGGCQTYAPEINQSYLDYGCNEENVFFLGVNFGASNSQLAQFNEDFGIEFPAASGYDGGGDKVINSWQIASYPTVVLVSPDHSIIKQYIWPPSNDTINSYLEANGGIWNPCYPVGLEETTAQLSNRIKSVYPNPAVEHVRIDYEISTRQNIMIEIFDIIGNRVAIRNKGVMGAGRHLENIQIDELAKGSYFINLRADGQVIDASKLIVQ